MSIIQNLTLTRKAKLEQAKQRNNVWGEQGRGPEWTLSFITLLNNVQMYNQRQLQGRVGRGTKLGYL